MPRRKPKNLIKPGEIRNPHGRPRGSVNKVNEEIREAFAMLLHSQLPNLEAWLERAAAKDPIKAADLMIRISERFLPSLQRTEITSADGQAFTPITINLPNIPQLHLQTGEGARTESLQLPDNQPVAALPEPSNSEHPGEGAHTSTFVDGELPAFTIPKFELSPNILRDIESFGEGAHTPGDGSPDFNGSPTGS